MLRQQIDLTTVYSKEEYERLAEQRQIEIPDLDPLPVEKPPCKAVEREPYLPDDQLVEVVNLAIALRRPLLLQGDPGCGKTRLAYAIAYALGWPLETGYIKSTSRAQDLLYTYDAVSRLYDAQLGTTGPRDTHGHEKSRDARNYVRLGPLGRAIARASHGRPSVVLIDEIDKADLDFPNDLLREIDRLEFDVPEVPGMSYKVDPDIRSWPVIVVTHNEEKALPSAFLRRCIFHVLRFPEDPDQLRKILDLHGIANPELSTRAVEILLRLRQIDFAKKPGLSELIDWVHYHAARGITPDRLNQLPAAGALLKQQADLDRAKKEWKAPSA